MVTRIIILFLLCVTTQAERVVLQRGGNPITDKVRCINVEDRAEWLKWIKHGHPVPVEYPALVDTDLRIWVAITGNYAHARADLRSADDARRPAKAELERALSGGTIKAKRKSLRDAINAAATIKAVRESMRDLDIFNEIIEAKRDEDKRLSITDEE